MFVCDAPVAGDFSNCDFTAATPSHPETGTFTLTAGTHVIVIDDFGANAAGASISISVVGP